MNEPVPQSYPSATSGRAQVDFPRAGLFLRRQFDPDPVGSAQYTIAKYASTPTIVAVQAIEAVRIKLSSVNANLHHEASRDGWSTSHKIAATRAI